MTMVGWLVATAVLGAVSWCVIRVAATITRKTRDGQGLEKLTDTLASATMGAADAATAVAAVREQTRALHERLSRGATPGADRTFTGR